MTKAIDLLECRGYKLHSSSDTRELFYNRFRNRMLEFDLKSNNYVVYEIGSGKAVEITVKVQETITTYMRARGWVDSSIKQFRDRLGFSRKHVAEQTKLSIKEIEKAELGDDIGSFKTAVLLEFYIRKGAFS